MEQPGYTTIGIKAYRWTWRQVYSTATTAGGQAAPSKKSSGGTNRFTTLARWLDRSPNTKNPNRQAILL